MYVVAELNGIGYEDGFGLAEVYGPFDSSEKAQAYLDKKVSENHYGLLFVVRKLQKGG